MRKPFTNVGPGDSIREELEHYGWDQKDLADIMGMTEKHIRQLARNKVPVTYETACQLSKTFKQSPPVLAESRCKLSPTASGGFIIQAPRQVSDTPCSSKQKY
jgi:transcriptional regulator with XRE-family HTH domain